jgi:hypothetical protein
MENVNGWSEMIPIMSSFYGWFQRMHKNDLNVKQLHPYILSKGKYT